MAKKGIETATLTYIILGLVFLFAAYNLSESFRGVIGGIIEALSSIMPSNSKDDQIAFSSMQALACAIDVTAYYSVFNAVPETGVDFGKFKSCVGESISQTATSAAVDDFFVEEEPGTTSGTESGDDGTPPADTGGGETTTSGTPVPCGGKTYYVSATDVGTTANMHIAFGADVADGVLSPCITVKDSCFLYSTDYSEATRAGIKVNIASIIGKTINIKARCSAEGGEVNSYSITGKILSGTNTTVGFSTAIIDTTKAFGDYITGRATETPQEPNKKCFGDGERCVVCDVVDGKFSSCSVKAFELRQKTGSSPVDYGLAWVNLVGEPYYLAYYETFPKEAAAAWSYSSNDIIWTAVAVGAVLNVGGIGKLAKATWAGAKTLKVGSKTVISAVIEREGIIEAFRSSSSAAGKAFRDRLALEYGGQKALQHVLAAESASAILGGEALKDIGNLAVKNSIYLRMINVADSAGAKVFAKLDSSRWEQDILLKEFRALVSGTKEIGEKDVDDIIKQLKPEGLGPVDATTQAVIDTLEGNKKGLVGDLNGLKKSYGEDTLLTANEKKALGDNIMRYMTSDADAEVSLVSGTFALKSDALKTYAAKTAKMAFGKDGGVFVKFHALPLETQRILTANRDEVAQLTYLKLMGRIDTVPGVEAAMKSDLIEAYAKEIESNELDQAAVAEAVKQANKLLPSADAAYAKIAGGTKLLTEKSKERRTQLLALAIGTSALAMMEHNLEKYTTTCNEDENENLCLHTPSILSKTIGDVRNYGEYNNKKVELEKDKSSYHGLIMLQYTGSVPLTTGQIRFNLASPCKTDLTIARSKCNCAEYVPSNIIKLNFIPRGGGGCAYEGNPKAGGRVYTRVKDANACCNAKDFVTREDLTNIGGYKEEDLNGEKISYTMSASLTNEEQAAEIENKKNEIMKTTEKINCGPTTKEYLLYSNVAVEPVNAKTGIKSGKTETITECTTPWIPFSGASRDCIIVELDKGSMKTYSEAGNFGNNYCFENKASLNDYAADVCFAGSLGLTLAVSGLSLGTGPFALAIIPAATISIGAVEGICGHHFEVMDRWPFNQY